MTLKSMTAFGSGNQETEDFFYTCEIKSLNSRFLEINTRLPRYLAMLEPEINKLIKTKLDRGKLDVFIDIRSQSIVNTLPRVNKEAVKHYLQCTETICEAAGIEAGSSPLSVSQFFNLDGVFDTSDSKLSGEEQLKTHREPLLAAINHATNELIKGRAREGEALKSSIKEHLDSLRAQHLEVKQMAPLIRERLESGFHKRIENTKAALIDKGLIDASEVSAERITTELILAVDKIDVSEELDRLIAHIDEFASQMQIGEKVGRRLDFICQEMHREVNTLSNKLVNAEISKLSVAMKQNVERVKQQVQNIE